MQQFTPALPSEVAQLQVWEESLEDAALPLELLRGLVKGAVMVSSVSPRRVQIEYLLLTAWRRARCRYPHASGNW